MTTAARRFYMWARPTTCANACSIIFAAGASDAKSRRLAAQVRRVEWTETAGELGAQLLEAREVRESQPAYNRQLRGGGERLTWLFDDGGRRAAAVVPIDAEVLRTGNAFGTYRAEHDARRALEELAREHRWCFKLLGLESGPGSLRRFAARPLQRRLRRQGAARVHLARVKLALMPQRLKHWPHDGPMLVREGAGERAEYHVIDGWQHLGTLDGDAVNAAGRARLAARSGRRTDFDIDSYRILTRMLREPRYRPLPLPRS